jgi:hypothetical protein
MTRVVIILEACDVSDIFLNIEQTEIYQQEEEDAKKLQNNIFYNFSSVFQNY